MDVKGVLFVGVGGDGIITVSNVLAEALMLAGFDVKKSEIHGMSQRGGSVSASVRFGDKVYSPTDRKGNVMFMIATEKVEAARWVEFLYKDSVVIVNDRVVPIMNAKIEVEKLDSFLDKLNTKVFIKRKFLEDALGLGNPRVTNTIMLGLMSRYLPIESDHVREAIERIVPDKVKEINIKAFEYGMKLKDEYDSEG